MQVLGGVFAHEGYVVGKVYADCRRDGLQDAGDPGIPGVRIYLEDGTYAVTDEEAPKAGKLVGGIDFGFRNPFAALWGRVMDDVLWITGERYLVQEGGNRPRFTGDGRHLYFVRGTADAEGRPRGELVRVTISSKPQVILGPAEVQLRIRPDGPA